MLVHILLIVLNYFSLSLLLYLLSNVTTSFPDFANPTEQFFYGMVKLCYLLAFEQILAFSSQLLVYYLCWKYSIVADNHARCGSVNFGVSS